MVEEHACDRGARMLYIAARDHMYHTVRVAASLKVLLILLPICRWHDVLQQSHGLALTAADLFLQRQRQIRTLHSGLV